MNGFAFENDFLIYRKIKELCIIVFPSSYRWENYCKWVLKNDSISICNYSLHACTVAHSHREHTRVISYGNKIVRAAAVVNAAGPSHKTLVLKMPSAPVLPSNDPHGTIFALRAHCYTKTIYVQRYSFNLFDVLWKWRIRTCQRARQRGNTSSERRSHLP